MKISAGFLGLILVGAAGWRLGSTLSPDALGMAVGMLFGILAGIPACLMILASRNSVERQPLRKGRFYDYPEPQPQTPKIEIHNHHYHGVKTVDQLLEELAGEDEDRIEETEWVRQLSTGSAPKRIATIKSNNSE